MRRKVFSLVCLSFILLASAALIRLGWNPTKLVERGESPVTASFKLSRARTVPSSPVANKPQVLASYARLPLSFELNQGQTDAQVRFLSHGSGYSLFLTRQGDAVLALRKSERKNALLNPLDLTSSSAKVGAGPADLPVIVGIKLLGANPTPQVEGLDELPGKVNYFIGSDPKQWRTNVPTYGKVRYRDIYPGVDLVHHGNHQQLEHDFIVAAGANPSAIRLAFEGPEGLTINAQGDLVISTKAVEVHLKKPLVYQDVNGTRREIAGHYALRGENQVGFIVGRHDTRKSLVIDPVLSYSTYLGGSGNDAPGGIAVDSSGSAYVAGYTSSTDFPTTAGSYQTSSAGGPYHAFVTKLAPAGNALVYSTFIGGSGEDFIDAQSLALDLSGNVYVAGATSSTDFPTTPGAYQTAFQEPTGDFFVTKINSAGNGLLYSTYLGNGAFPGEGAALAIDSSGSAYVFGPTGSASFPVTPGAFQTTYGGGGSNEFIAKLNPACSGLVYSTYLGGNVGESHGLGIRVDSLGNAYVTAGTYSTNFPTTPGAFQTSLNGPINAFVTEINPTGSALVYSTYLGGSAVDVGLNLAIDSIGNAYVIGYTQSSDFPLTPGAFQTSLKGSSQTNFVTKLNASGTGLVYSTFLGGSGVQSATGVVLDAAKNAYVAGNTTSTDFPTANPIQATNAGGVDGFVAELNAAGSSLLFSTYLGGSGFDAADFITLDASGNIYLDGHTSSADFPTTPGAFRTANSGGINDAFVVKIADFHFPSSGSFVIGNLNAAVGDTVTFWGAQWAKVNSLSGGSAPAAFKGFADMSSTAPPACGGTWTSSPGNSSGPPATVPELMAVIASSSVTKSGSTISGNIPKIVIVQPSPGYGPSPGQTGTGTVVAVLCGN